MIICGSDFNNSLQQSYWFGCTEYFLTNNPRSFFLPFIIVSNFLKRPPSGRYKAILDFI